MYISGGQVKMRVEDFCLALGIFLDFFAQLGVAVAEFACLFIYLFI